jgi:hypothetical protein
LTIGANDNTGLISFNGKLDELKIVSTNRPADWIATEYANQNAPPSIGSFTAVASVKAYIF